MKLFDVEAEFSDLNIQCIHVSAEEGERRTSIHGCFLDQKLEVAGSVVFLRVGRSNSVQIRISEQLDSSFQIDRLRKASVHLVGVLSVSCLSVAVGQCMCSNLLYRNESRLVQQVLRDGLIIFVGTDGDCHNRGPIGRDHATTHLFDGKKQLLRLCREGMGKFCRVGFEKLDAFRKSIVDRIVVEERRSFGKDENMLGRVVSHVGRKSRRW